MGDWQVRAEVVKISLFGFPVGMETWSNDMLKSCYGEAGVRLQQFFELAFDHLGYPSTDLTRMKSLLIVGDSGTGKSASLAIAAKNYQLSILQSSIGDLVKEYPNQLDKGFIQLVKRAQKQQSCLIVLDNIELMFPKSGLLDTHLEMVALNHLQDMNEDAPVIIGVCIDPSLLNDDIKRSFDVSPTTVCDHMLVPSSHVLQEIIQLEIPTPSERLSMFQGFADQLRLSEDIDIKSLSAKLHSYKMADVYMLLRLADELRCMRGAETISEKDILGSMKNVNPIGNVIDRTAERPETIKWEDIGGLNDAKRDLKECTSWMQGSYEEYRRLGASPTKGLLLYGPPGTGKTLLAKAIANESSTNFLAVSIPELIKGEVGESEKAVARIFATARRCSPCVIFLDELEAIFGSRDTSGNLGQKVKFHLITQLMMELDLLNSGADMVLVVAATNHPESIDRAILRPGRLDQHIYIALPTMEERLSILQLLCSKSNVTDELDLEQLARMTERFTGADMQALLRKAGLCALKRQQGLQTVIQHQDFLTAITSLKASVSEEQQLRYSRFAVN
ncbi:hypothetical protein NQZ79_g706 [Umbelopsis isabellina]|nr:hypothetical protein NQZ79_g706 [Umbelopsis isabellina]